MVDREDIRRRILRATADVVDVEVPDDAIAVTWPEDPDSVMLTVLAPNGVWYVQHLWGAARSWLRMIKMTAMELLGRGHGDTPVRWSRLTDRPLLDRAVARLNVRTVRDDETGRLVWEITANEALALLARVVV